MISIYSINPLSIFALPFVNSYRFFCAQGSIFQETLAHKIILCIYYILMECQINQIALTSISQIQIIISLECKMSDENQMQNSNLPGVFDDKPIGKTAKFDIPEYSSKLFVYEDDNPNPIQEQQKQPPLPLEKRVRSAVWKIRKQAYQELLEKVKENIQAFRQFDSQIIKFITDSNWMCQERALKVLLTYLSSNGRLQIDTRTVIKTIIEKCLVSDKEQIKKQSAQILFLLLDNGQEEILLSQLNQELLNKNPKICASAISFLTLLLNNYGIKRLKTLQKFEKHLGLLSGSVKPIAKAAQIQLYKELFKWIGQSCLKDFNIHYEIKDEVTKFASTYQRQPLQIKRGIKKEAIESKKTFHSLDDDEEPQEPLDILIPYSQKWVDETLAIEKWKEKKIVLEEFIKKTSVKRIIPRQNSQFIKLISMLLNDNNLNLLFCGLKITQNLCNGLKKSFAHVSRNILEPLFGKLKDSKPAVVEETQRALKSMINCLTMDQFMKEIRLGLDDKTPNMRLQTLKFLMNFIYKNSKCVPNIRELLDKIIKMNEDGNADVRNMAIEVLCKIKIAFGIQFFGQKLKRLPQKKIEQIQCAHSSEPQIEMMDIQDHKVSLTIITEPKKQIPAIKSGKIDPKPQIPSKKAKQFDQISQTSQQNQRSYQTKFSLGINICDLTAPMQSVRLNAYTILEQRQLPLDTIYVLKSKACRQSSAHILKCLIAIVKKIFLGGTIEESGVQLLLMHDWRKCKHLLTEFIQTSRFTRQAQELIKNNGILPQPKKQANSNPPPSNANAGLALKVGFLELQNLLPKMSNPIDIVKSEAADLAIQTIEGFPKVNESDIASSADFMNQIYNVIKCRLNEQDEHLLSKYCKLTTIMAMRGLITKNKGAFALIPVVIKRLKDHPFVKQVLHQFVVHFPYYTFTFFPAELGGDVNTQPLIQFIFEENANFVKHAQMKNYIIPLLNAIGYAPNYAAKESCHKLLDQIVELVGQKVLEQQVKKGKFVNVDDYLSKWNINLQNQSQIPSMMTKIERLRMEEANPWPIAASPSHIHKLINYFLSLGEPFTTLANPIGINQSVIILLNHLQSTFISQNSDLLLKWVFWRVLTDKESMVNQIFQFSIKIIQIVNHNLSQAEVIIVLSAMLNCLSLTQDQHAQAISEVCRNLSMIGSVYTQKCFRFWINSLSDPSIPSPTKQILDILIKNYPDLINSELVTLARIPNILSYPEFNQYLNEKYDDRLLSVYGFKKKVADEKQDSLIFLSSLSGPEFMINASPEEIAFYYDLFSKSSSEEMMQKINEITQCISPSIMMETHLKIMYSIIVPVLNRQIPFLNPYTYFKELLRVVTDSLSTNSCNQSQKLRIFPYLSNVVRILIFFLLDLGQIKADNKNQLIRVVNKILLLLLQQAPSKHMMEIFLSILKNLLQRNNISIKYATIIPKCIGKLSRTQQFRDHTVQYIRYLLNETFELMNLIPSQLCTADHQFMLGVKCMLSQIIQIIGQPAIHQLQQFIENQSLNSVGRSLLMQKIVIFKKQAKNAIQTPTKIEPILQTQQQNLRLLRNVDDEASKRKPLE